MFGGAGFNPHWKTNEAAGLYASADALALVRLSASEDAGGRWMVSESHTAENHDASPADANALAAHVREELLRRGWEKLPLALAVPESAAETQIQELPVPLAASDLREALLWSLRAAADEKNTPLPADICLCCMPLTDAPPYRYWTARMDAAQVRGYFSAFAAAGLHLRRLTVCPPRGGMLAEDIERAREPRMPWETETPHADGLLPAVYAGLLMRAHTPAHLYWCARSNPLARMRSYAASLIAAAATAAFLAAAGADIAACAQAEHSRAQAEEELTLRGADLRRMEELSAMHGDVARREQTWMAFAESSPPLRALLVHLGTAALDHVRLTGITAAAQHVRIEGEAATYEALVSLMHRMDEQKFFSSDVSLMYAGQEAAEDESIRFVLEARW